MTTLNRVLADCAQDVETFNRAIIGLPEQVFQRRLNPERKAWATGAILEELTEFRDAETLEDEADALVDLIYFAAGRLVEMNLPVRACFTEVHRANMGKRRGELSKRPGSQGYDAVKPEGWAPPDYSELLVTLTRDDFSTLAALRSGAASLRLTKSDPVPVRGFGEKPEGFR